MTAPRSLRVAVDVGGTFTDLQILDERTGQTFAAKTPTTPADPSEGLITGLREAGARFGFAAADVSALMHGTTIGTNAVLQRRLPKGGLITTFGFEDVLEIGRHFRRDVYANRAEPRALLIPRALRLGVRERTRANGEIEAALDAGHLAEIVAKLRAADVRAVAVCLLHAY
ncbi:MAG: hydantoinase/oxoprolinase N-terminal domain-containing protein, partial [Hyphomicrobiaceae bacterium]